MDEPTPQIDHASIVLLGSFNPQIYQPAWFAAQGLIRGQEADKAQIGIVHKELTDFTSDWLRVQVTQDRLYVGNTDAGHWQQLMEFVVGTFRILEHTPVRAIGLNRMMHFAVRSDDIWHAIGDRLVPKDFWRSVMAGRPGMATLTVQGKRPGADEKAVLKAKVEPSTRPEVQPHGIYIDTNEEYIDDKEGSLRRLLEILAKNWEPALQHSLRIAQGIIGLGIRNVR